MELYICLKKRKHSESNISTQQIPASCGNKTKSLQRI